MTPAIFWDRSASQICKPFPHKKPLFQKCLPPQFCHQPEVLKVTKALGDNLGGPC